MFPSCTEWVVDAILGDGDYREHAGFGHVAVLLDIQVESSFLQVSLESGDVHD